MKKKEQNYLHAVFHGAQTVLSDLVFEIHPNFWLLIDRWSLVNLNLHFEHSVISEDTSLIGCGWYSHFLGSSAGALMS